MKKFGTAAILCGGRSRRMGFDKRDIKIKDKLLIEIIAEQLEEVFDEVILVSNDKDKFKHMKYKVVEDIIPDSGAVGGIYTALSNSSSKFLFITACDMPIVNLDYIRYMMGIIENSDVLGVVSNNLKQIEPLHAFYSNELIPTLKNNLEQGNLRLLNIISCCNLYYVKDEIVQGYCKKVNFFTNLNYKSDLTFLEKTFNYVIEEKTY